MTPLAFVYWLQGYMEIGDPKTLDEKQVQEIKNHIALVLNKVTPTAEITPDYHNDLTYDPNNFCKITGKPLSELQDYSYWIPPSSSEFPSYGIPPYGSC